ncbi:hypothetical protein [Paractinoplanes atraurantiacus]|nr:hypothetical protein [Actinoplanes atraurantiacus]
MTNKLFKIDRVRSVEEAVEVDRLGADLIGVAIDRDPRFDDGRYVRAEEVASIAAAVRQAEVVVMMDLLDDPGRVLDIVRMAEVRSVQPIAGRIPPLAVRGALREIGVGIVYGGIEIAHDDAPEWVFDLHDATPQLDVEFFQVDLLPEYRDSWAFLRDRSPEFPEEFQVADLNAFARDRPLLIGLDFTVDNIGEISAALPEVRGFAVTIGDGATRSGVHSHSYNQSLKVLQARPRA